ncbi:RTA1 domain-containing protein [Phanerochaete sordida]|uniref:RTA1 domain-containing protein n=1 Tax=Phanerochaete sordida TaxID=48140 RepID=A0A9P3FZM0_9APHY|nr:RTA1 domain-containing protein [Phanerochaete sordida]
MSSNTTATGSDDIWDSSPYHYVPTEYVAIIFIVLFGITTASWFVTALWYRLWFLLPTAFLAGAGEVLGWAGRLWSNRNINNQNAFMTQITCTIIAPTPFLAAIFILFAALSTRLGPSYGRLTPVWYSRIFLTCDIIALAIQGTGGGIASSAADDDSKTQNLGSHVMLAGIIFQLIALGIFMLLAAEYFWRFLKDRPYRSTPNNNSVATLYLRRHWTMRLKLFSAATAFSTLTLFIRAIYRVIELAGGWNGRIIGTQVYFNVLDGAMVVLAMYSLTFFNPAWFLYSQRPVGEDDEADKEADMSPNLTR